MIGWRVTDCVRDHRELKASVAKLDYAEGKYYEVTMLQSVAILKDVPRYRMRRTGCYPRRSTCWGLGIAGAAELNTLGKKKNLEHTAGETSSEKTIASDKSIEKKI